MKYVVVNTHKIVGPDVEIPVELWIVGHAARLIQTHEVDASRSEYTMNGETGQISRNGSPAPGLTLVQM